MNEKYVYHFKISIFVIGIIRNIIINVVQLQSDGNTVCPYTPPTVQCASAEQQHVQLSGTGE
jgi:hypothetical protein